MDEILKVNIERFDYEKETILEDVSFSAKKGECIVLTGLSGCGKTTLLRLLNGLIPELYEGSLKGRIEILGKEISAYQKGELAKVVGNVFQNPHDQFFSTTVEDEIALVGENMGMEREELVKRVEEAIKRLNIEKLSGRSVYELSGGEKQKVAIASTLVYDTDIILFDEPSASLDYQAIRELAKTIDYLKKMGKLILIAEHRLYYLKDLVDRLLILKDGGLKRIYTAKEVSHEICVKHDLRSFDERRLVGEASPAEGREAVFVQNVFIKNNYFTFSVPLNLSLSEGECMGIIGSNGIGKSTLARQLTGLLPIKKGETSYGSRSGKRLKNTAITLQHPAGMLFRDTVEREMIQSHHKKDEAYLQLAKSYLFEMDLWEKKLHCPKDLSGGEKQRLVLILSFLKQAQLDILDEPTSGLDYKRMELVANAIRNKKKKSPTILITHDLELLFKCCNSVLMLKRDKIEKINVIGNEDRIRSFLNEEAC